MKKYSRQIYELSDKSKLESAYRKYVITAESTVGEHIMPYKSEKIKMTEEQRRNTKLTTHQKTKLEINIKQGNILKDR